MSPEKPTPAKPRRPAGRSADRSGPGPLGGLTVLNTRAAAHAGTLTKQLEALGARVLERPMLAFAPPASWQPFDARLAALRPGDWIAFTSANGVRHFMARLRELGREPTVAESVRVAAVGNATAAVLAAEGIPVALVPEHFQGEALLAAFTAQLRPGDRVWLPQAEQARDVLAQGLRAAGIAVEVTPVYRTVMPAGGLGPALEVLEAGRLDWILFTSPSTVRHFLAMLPAGRGDLMRQHQPRIACLGAITAAAARAQGLTVTVVPERQDQAGLLDALVHHMQTRG